MEVRRGAYGKVTINGQKTLVSKKQEIFIDDRLVPSTIIDCVISAFVDSIKCQSLPKLTDVHLYRSDVDISMPYYGIPICDWARATPRQERFSQLPNLILQLIEACERLFENGIQHTDIKPLNVLVHRTKNELTLIDFNLVSVKTIDGWSQSYGTWCYVAPEILNDEAPSDTSMVWSIGIILAEICGGFPPGDFRDLVADITSREQWQAYMDKVRVKSPDGLHLSATHESIMSPDMIDIYKYCMRWDPLQRPSLRELRQRVQQTLAPLYIAPFRDHMTMTITLNRKAGTDNRDAAIDTISTICRGDALRSCLYRSIFIMDLTNCTLASDLYPTLYLMAYVSLAYMIMGYGLDKTFVKLINDRAESNYHLHDIEHTMLQICVDLGWDFYDKGADVAALALGMTITDVVAHLPGVMKSIESPYSTSTVASALYKAKQSSNIKCKQLDSSPILTNSSPT